MKIEHVQCGNHANSGKIFRNRWTVRMVRRLGKVGIVVREGLGRQCQPVKQETYS